MNYYAALDVSLRSVHLCVVDDEGALITETKLSSEVTVESLGYEAGQNTWSSACRYRRGPKTRCHPAPHVA